MICTALIVTLLSLPGPAAAVEPAAPAVVPGAETAGAVDPRADAPLSTIRRELLEAAFLAASKIPVDPHVDSRSKAQKVVFDACLELGQAERALAYSREIRDWRRGVARAELALHLIEHGETDVDELLTAARFYAMDEDEWRRDRINVNIARAYTLLGREQDAAVLEDGLMHRSEMGKVDAARVRVMGEDGFDERVAALENVMKANVFDASVNALDTFVELYRRFYADSEARATVETRVIMLWDGLPRPVRTAVMFDLIDVALDHGDRANASALIDLTAPLLEQGDWSVEVLIRHEGRLAALRGRAGDVAGARVGVERAVARFDEFIRSEAGVRRIVDVFQAETLRPAAEALAASGDREASLELYRRVLEVGAQNANGRPRAVDYAGTLASMARHDITPDDAMRTRIREIFEGLKHPW